MGKRGNGEGSLFKRKDGYWVAAITTGFDMEKAKAKQTRKYFKTRAEAAHWLEEVQHQRNIGQFSEPGKLTMEEWLRSWLDLYCKPEVRASTFGVHKMAIEARLIPALGHYLLRDLQTRHIQLAYQNISNGPRKDNKKAGKISLSTLRRYHVVLHKALKQAVSEGLIFNNPADAVKFGKANKKEMRVLNPDEVKKFVETLKGHKMEAAFLLLLGTGMRRGEVLALQWKNVDLEDKVIKVRRTVVRVKAHEGEPTKTKLVYQEPKTAKGVRSIPMPDDLIPILKAHSAKQAQDKLVAGSAYKKDDLVFANPFGKGIDPDTLKKAFYSITARAGLEHANIHSLRHTYATMLLQRNVPAKVAQELLGHSSISITLDIYSHVMPEMKREAVKTLNGLFQG